MSNALIVRLQPLTAAMFTPRIAYAGINPAFPAGNLADRQPKKVCQGNTGSNPIGICFDIDLGADTAFDTVATIAANLSVSNGLWAVYGFTAAAGLPALGSEGAGAQLFGSGGASPFGIAPTTRSPVRSAFLTGASVTRRYLRVYLQDLPGANPAGVVNAGVFCIGQKLAPAWNFELGSGRKIEDQSVPRTLPGGETYTEEGGRVPMWRGTFSNLSEAEFRQAWSIMQEIGTGRPLLFIEDPDALAGQAEGIVYGQLTALDFTERVQLEKQRIDLTIRALV